MWLDTFRSKESDYTAEVAKVEAEAMKEGIDEGCWVLDKLVYEFDFSQKGLCAFWDTRLDDFLEAFKNANWALMRLINVRNFGWDKKQYEEQYNFKTNEYQKHIVQELIAYHWTYKTAEQYKDFLNVISKVINFFDGVITKITQDEKIDMLDLEKNGKL